MKKPLIIGHRGYSSKYTENTIESFKAAFDISDGIECDVQKTSDGKYVILHNDYIEKDGYKYFLNKSHYKDLKQYFPQLPLLEELVDICPDSKLVNIELKDDTLEMSDLDFIIKKISKLNKEKVIISSFNNEFLKYFKSQDYKTGFLIGERHQKMGFKKILKLIRSTSPDYINLPVQAFHQAGKMSVKIMLMIFKSFRYKIIFWTINNKAELMLVEKSSRIIISDTPDYDKLKQIDGEVATK